MIKFAIIGYGRIGKRYHGLIEQHPDCKLTTIIDPNHPEPTLDTVAEILLKQIDVDCAVISTPNHLHTPIALLLLDAGINVIIEKPISFTRKGAEAIQEASINAHSFVVMQNRYSPVSRWLKSIVSKLGRIYTVVVNCFWNRGKEYYMGHEWHGSKIKDGGVLYTQFSHFLDIVQWCFGKINPTQATFYNHSHPYIEIEDSGTVHFDLPQGKGILNFSTSCFSENMESSITILAENGSVKVGGQYMNEVAHCDIKNYQLPEICDTTEPNDYGSYKGSASNHAEVIQNVVETLQGKSKPDVSISDGVELIDSIEKMYKIAKFK